MSYFWFIFFFFNIIVHRIKLWAKCTAKPIQHFHKCMLNIYLHETNFIKKYVHTQVGFHILWRKCNASIMHNIFYPLTPFKPNPHTNLFFSNKHHLVCFLSLSKNGLPHVYKNTCITIFVGTKRCRVYQNHTVQQLYLNFCVCSCFSTAQVMCKQQSPGKKESRAYRDNLFLTLLQEWTENYSKLLFQ